MTRHRHTHDDAPDCAGDFAQMARLAPGPQRERARERVVVAWLPMAHRIAGRYRDRGEALEDLRQVAALALVKAVDGYDPDRGYAFASYAVPTITGEVRRHFRDCSWSVHVPRRVRETRNAIRPVCQELAASGRTPTVAAVAARTRLPEAEVADGMEALHAHTALSLDAPAAGGGEGPGGTLGDLVAAPDTDPALDRVLDREAARPVIADLTAREQRLLYLRFYRGMTQSRIGEELGVSQFHVSRLLADTCRRIRRTVLDDGRDER
ncbi:SigB/SigF/SigG family RNA polymerase sigma factor [Streptomyces sp. NPDC057638]|uniref:SigB/SigF/SigG family RNA polymerase sigma factor n=1 Tax=Streptomyces sp. NPDC057638 TaxID=3346190 RepID=UPI00367AB767